MTNTRDGYSRGIRRERDDTELVAAAQAGDSAAMDALLRRHYDRIHALCRRITGNEADALDATQNALMAIVRGLHSFDGRSAFTTWSYRVASNACYDEIRRRKRRPDPGLPEHYEPVDAAGDVGTTVTDRMTVEEALADLPEEFRAPVILRDVADMEYSDIAETLGIPAGTVRSRISRGRAALARRISGNQSPSTERRST